MIYGDRIRLRANERDDIALFVRWLNDPEVRRGLLIHLPISQAEEEVWFENMLKRPKEQRPLLIEVRQKDNASAGESWIPIGNCAFDDIDWRNRSGVVGIVIGEKSYWNQGYGTETMLLLLKHGFQTLNLNRISLLVFANNQPAIRAYEKAGFAHEGRMRQAEYRGGQYLDVLLMSVLREEWVFGELGSGDARAARS